MQQAVFPDGDVFRMCGMYEGGQGGPKPVKVGDVVDVTIEAVAAKGDGIAKIDGFVIFVKGAAMGATIKVKIIDVKNRFAIGEPAA